MNRLFATVGYGGGTAFWASQTVFTFGGNRSHLPRDADDAIVQNSTDPDWNSVNTNFHDLPAACKSAPLSGEISNVGNSACIRRAKPSDLSHP